MIAAPLPENEAERLNRLELYDVLDTPAEEAFDCITRMVAEIIDVPIALISLVDRDRQWFKSHHGLDATETHRDFAFCAHAILDRNIFIIEDATQDERFKDNPLVTDAPSVHFYAGSPLLTADGYALGTLCVIDRKPRTISAAYQQLLRDFAGIVVDELELRLALKHAMKENADAAHLQTMQSKFISLVSHELRTPLTSILGTLKLIHSGITGDLPEKTAELVEIANRNTENLLDLVNDLLDVQKISAGKFDFEFTLISIDTLLQDVSQNIQGYAKENDVTLEIEVEPNLPAIIADPNRLRQALVNLTSNAIKVEPKQGTVRLRALLHDAMIEFQVSDHGAGIPENFHNRMYDSFSQVSTPGKNKGTGLGLTICKSVIEAHNGNIRFESSPDTGTTFFVSIPIKQVITTLREGY